MTATTAAARDHARSMAGTVVDTMPTMPPTTASGPPAGVDLADLLWDEVVAGGGYTSIRVPRGARVRLLDRDGDACAGLLLHRASRPTERLNVADTVKIQWQAYLAEGQLLLSDLGNVLAAMIEDTSGRHDTFCGTTNRRANELRYGDGAIDGPSRNGRDLFALALAKQGLERRDVAPNVNFFKGTRADGRGALTLLPSAPPGSQVTLRCEVGLIVTIVNVPHPLDDRPGYTVSPLRVTVWRGVAAGPDDPIRNSTPEGTRAYVNTETSLMGESS
jgi:uncharacterized protein